MSSSTSVTDPNSRACIVTAIYLGVVGVCVFVVQPVFNQVLVTSLGLTPQQVGYLASVEMWGLAATSIALTVLIGRVSWRKVTIGSLLIAVIGNLATIGQTDFTVLMITRAITGIGLGAMITIPIVVMGFTRNPDRNIGLIVTFSLVYGALMSYAIPWAVENFSLNAVLLFFAIFAVVAIPFVRFIPSAAVAQAEATASGATFTGNVKTLTVTAVFLFGVAVTMVWAFAILVGTNGGLEEQTAAIILGNSQFLGILGAFLAAMLGKRYGRTFPVSLGILGCGAAAATLLSDVTYLTYSVAIFLYSFCWNFFQPYLMAILTDFQDGGKTVTRGIAIQMIALAIGPYIGANLVRDGGRHLYDVVNLVGAIVFVLSLLFIIPGLRAQHRAVLARASEQSHRVHIDLE
jgi:predicted MFS family arabinose efflux permease